MSLRATTNPKSLKRMLHGKNLHLHDLPVLQNELEKILAETLENACFVRHQLHNERLPDPLKQKVGLLPDDVESLSVKSDPEKPLKLIFSPLPKSGTALIPHQPTFELSVSDPNFSPNYIIPNKFWALMEPYCAEITESNIAFIEQVIKTYQDELKHSKLFQLPEASTIIPNSEGSSLSSRRDSINVSWNMPYSPVNSETLDPSQHNQLRAASSLVSVAKKIDSDLKGKTSHFLLIADKPAELLVANQLSESIVADMCEENILCLKKIAQAGRKSKSFKPEAADSMKNIAKQLKVSSSYRIEKKVAQAISELGLSPLNVFIQPSCTAPILQSNGKRSMEDRESKAKRKKMDKSSFSVERPHKRHSDMRLVISRSPRQQNGSGARDELRDSAESHSEEEETANQSGIDSSLSLDGMEVQKSPRLTNGNSMYEDETEDLKNCLLDISSSLANGNDVEQDTPLPSAGTSTGSIQLDPYATADAVTWALVQRQRELKTLCSSNIQNFRRLLQQAKKDMQRQEIQRRLAIADADVIETFNKINQHKSSGKALLKRDKDAAWKCIKERKKILLELESFDRKHTSSTFNLF
ncbi:transcriptional adaptor 3 [Cichlidogyrus casuarinus]|uniref:Transcriptional adaptor 3 n=1 Tax=Cichlidogyrus casuarinus TaxID=1844966 RepID=A0ABD2PMX8_9PLAT